MKSPFKNICAVCTGMVCTSFIVFTTPAHANKPQLPEFNHIGFQSLVDCQNAVPTYLKKHQANQSTSKPHAAMDFLQTLHRLNLDVDNEESWRSREFLPLEKLPSRAGVAQIIAKQRYQGSGKQSAILYKLKSPVRVSGKKTPYVMVSYEFKGMFYEHLDAERYRVMALFPAKGAKQAIEQAHQLNLPVVYDLPKRILAQKNVFAENLSHTFTQRNKTYTKKYSLAIQQQLKFYPHKFEEMRKEDEMSASRFLINTYKTQKIPELNPEAITQVGCTYVRAYDKHLKHSTESLGIKPTDILNGFEWVK